MHILNTDKIRSIKNNVLFRNGFLFALTLLFYFLMINASSGSILSGSTVSPPASANLSVEGSLDWAHWGLANPSSFNHKSGVTQQISNYTLLGSNNPGRFTGARVAYSWSDGTPTLSATASTTGIYFFGIGNGYQLTLPADTTERTLKLYIGLWHARGRFEARLSDNSAPAFVQVFDNPTGILDTVVTLNFSAASSGASLIIEYIVEDNYGQSFGNITLQAATLMGGMAGNQPPVLDPIGGRSVDEGQTLTFIVTASDLDGTIPSLSATNLPGTATFLENSNGTGTFTWNTVAGDAGTYTNVTFTAIDAVNPLLTDSEAITITVNSNTGDGTISGSTVSPPASANLSVEGSLDWAHWGLANPSSFNHKSGVTQQISNYTLLGSNNPGRFTGARVAYSWSGGTPTLSTPGSTTGIYFYGIGNGYQLTLPADTTERTLKLYIGLWHARGRFEARLSDNSAPAFVQVFDNPTGILDTVVTLNFSAASSGASLIIEYIVEDNYGQSFGNITLQAATLMGGMAGDGTISGSTVSPPASANLSVEGSLDWAHWGLANPSSFNHKSGVTQQISNYTLLGSNNPGRFTGARVAYSWSDGTPTLSATASTTGIYFFGIGNGYQLTLPADTTERTLKLYIGLWHARGRFEARLSDNSAPAFVQVFDNPTGILDTVVTLNFSAASSGASLIIEYIVEDNYGQSFGNITLQAATLMGGMGGNQLPISDNFNDGNANGWTVVNDSAISSNWQVLSGKYQQLNRVESVNSFSGSYHLGTYSYLSSGIVLTNYRFSVEMTFLQQAEGKADDIGLMFRYQNNNNYYRLSFNSRYGFTRLEKKVAGQFTTLAKNSRGYIVGAILNVTIEADGSSIRVYFNGDPLFSVSDSSLTSGTVALYGQEKSSFDNVFIDNVSTQPSVVMSEPVSYSIKTTNTLNVSAIAANVPSGGRIRFVLDGTSIKDDFSFPYNVQFPGVSSGEHIVDAILLDSSGSELTRDTNNRIGVMGDYVWSVGDSITNGEKDNYSFDNKSQDGRIISLQGYEALLNNLLTNALSYPNIIYNEGIGGDESWDAAFKRIDSILERHPGSNKALILLGTNDSGGTLPVPSGLGCVGPSCDGTFKGNMQTLVDKIITAGKTVVVGLVPPAFGAGTGSVPYSNPLSASRNQLIQQYNQVITSELANIQIGPNFNSFFLSATTNRFSVFSDTLHFNGLGYVVVSRLWNNVLTGSNIQTFILENLVPSKVAPFLKQNILEVGDKYYVDEVHTLNSLPSVLNTGIWVMTANADKNNSTSNYLSFNVDRNVRVYIAYDSGATLLPAWLTSTFTPTGLQLSTTNPAVPTFNLYSRDFVSGNISLGGNRAGGANALANYIAIVVEN